MAVADRVWTVVIDSANNLTPWGLTAVKYDHLTARLNNDVRARPGGDQNAQATPFQCLSGESRTPQNFTALLYRLLYDTRIDVASRKS